MTRIRLTLFLDEGECDALLSLARHERRDPRSQAMIMIRRELERAGLLPADKFGSVEFHATTVNIYGNVAGRDYIGASDGQSTKPSPFAQRRQSRLHGGYLLAAVILAAFAIIVSLIAFPEWSQSVRLLVVLAVSVILAVVALIANWRQAFEILPNSAWHEQD